MLVDEISLLTMGRFRIGRGFVVYGFTIELC